MLVIANFLKEVKHDGLKLSYLLSRIVTNCSYLKKAFMGITELPMSSGICPPISIERLANHHSSCNSG